MIRFFVDIPGGPPTITDQQKRIGLKRRKDWFRRRGAQQYQPVVYKQTELRQVYAQMQAWLWPHRPLIPWELPLRFELYFIWPWRKADAPKRLKGKLQRILAKDTVPDTENLVKGLKDQLAPCGYLRNDAQIFAEETHKYWGDRPGFELRLFPWTTDYEPPEVDEL